MGILARQGLGDGGPGPGYEHPNSELRFFLLIELGCPVGLAVP